LAYRKLKPKFSLSDQVMAGWVGNANASTMLTRGFYLGDVNFLIPGMVQGVTEQDTPDVGGETAPGFLVVLL